MHTRDPRCIQPNLGTEKVPTTLVSNYLYNLELGTGLILNIAVGIHTREQIALGSIKALTTTCRNPISTISALSSTRRMPISREVCQERGCYMSWLGTYILYLAILPFLIQLWALIIYTE